jgi:hypothetical protein
MIMAQTGTTAIMSITIIIIIPEALKQTGATIQGELHLEIQGEAQVKILLLIAGGGIIRMVRTV